MGVWGGLQAAKGVNGAKRFVYGPGHSDKGHLPGVTVDNDMMDGAPNPFGEIMKAREQELVEVPSRARTEELNGLSSLLTPASKGKGKGLTQQQLAVLRDDSRELVADFFGGDKTARTAHAAEPAMAAAGEPRSNEHGGLLAAADGAEEGVASPDVKRAAKMRADAAKVMRERADAREMRRKGEERRARAQKRQAEQLALKLDGTLPVREEGALLARSEEKYVHALESKLRGPRSFERTAQKQRAQEHRILHAHARQLWFVYVLVGR